MPISDNEFYSNGTINIEITDKNSFMLLSKVWLSLDLFPRNPLLLTKFLLI